MPDMQKSNPPGAATPGGSLCLLALAVTVKPLADAMANYTCCNGHKDAGYDFHADTSFLLPEWRRTAEL